MSAKRPPTGTDADQNLATLSHLFVDEDKASEFLESKRWPDGTPVCPHCGGEGYALTAKPGSKRPGRPGLKKCKKCRKQFAVRVGTIFEESKIPVRKWLMAIHLMTSSKKGVSSHQIAREVGITQKSAWFVCHRIREAMRQEPLAAMLKGKVEMDETYIGGKPRYKGQSKQGRGTSKSPVVVLVERDGRARSFPVDRVDAKSLHTAAIQHIDSGSTVFTDEFASYLGIGQYFVRHHAVNHGSKAYVRIEGSGEAATTNTAESYFALLKRGHYGVFHHFSRPNLRRYCNEFSFRWDHRKVSDGTRMVAAI